MGQQGQPVGENENAYGDEQKPARDFDSVKPSLRLSKKSEKLRDAQGRDKKRDSQTQRIKSEQGHALKDSFSRARVSQNARQNRPDARGPAKGKSSAHDKTARPAHAFFTDFDLFFAEQKIPFKNTRHVKS